MSNLGMASLDHDTLLDRFWRTPQGLTTAQAARVLCLETVSVQCAVSRGVCPIPYERIGTHFRFRAEDVARWAAKRKARAA